MNENIFSMSPCQEIKHENFFSPDELDTMSVMEDNDTMIKRNEGKDENGDVAIKIEVMTEEYGESMHNDRVTIEYMKEEEKEKVGETSNNSKENVKTLTWKISATVAARSVPDGLMLKCSDLAEEVSGIFTVKQITKGAVFGPYVGEHRFNREESFNNGYSWDIFVNNKFHHCIDARDSNKANWMRYVNFAGFDNVQNLEAFQRNHEIFYRAIKHIPTNTELLVWHADAYYQDISLHYPKIKSKKNKSLLEIMSNRKEFDNVNINKNGRNNHINNNNVIKKTIVNRNVVMRSKKSYSDKKFQCDVCNYTCTRSGHLTTHKRSHTGEKPFKCEVCDKAFTTSSHLTTHKLTHTGEKLFRCDVCGKAFTTSSDLTTHKRSHTGETPFKCDVCDKAFTTSGNLTTHTRSHTGEKPFKCDVCDKAFTTSGNLTAHKRGVHRL